MKGSLKAVLGIAVLLAPLYGSGCGLERLKESNRRLKDSNDRLVAENNRLEEELAAMQRRVAEGQQAPAPAPAAVATADPATLPPTDMFAGLDPDDPIDVTRVAEGIRITIPERVFFALGQASLSVRGRSTLDRIAGMIKTQYPSRTVRVDGHTDDTPISKIKDKYPTNWELSTARACVVVRYLIDSGLSPQRIYPAGFAYYKPISNGRSAASKSQNRRVEITILNDGSV